MMYYNEDEDGYMEQEEAWDYEGLLDPAWETQQRKVKSAMFTCKKSLTLLNLLGNF
jgi:hypothetical protein